MHYFGALKATSPYFTLLRFHFCPILSLGRYNYSNQDATPAPRAQIASGIQWYHGLPEVSRETFGTIHVDKAGYLC